jgi:hypothetical protein
VHLAFQIEKLTLIVVEPPHHCAPPQQSAEATESLFAEILNGLLQQNLPIGDIWH